MIEVSDFEQEVLQASYEKPVLVDFWAPWCGPCRQLGPILEKLDEEDESFTLAKLNTDLDQTTAMRYRVQSIPAVKLFVDGEVKDEFLGALPEPQVRRWLKDALPSEARALVEKAQALIAAGDTDAEATLEQALALEPENPTAQIELAKLVVFREPERALELAQSARRSDASVFNDTQNIETLVKLLKEQPDASALPEDPAKTPYLEGLARLREGNVDAALAGFVDSVRRNKRYNDEAARLASLALFSVLGQKHPLTQKHRRALEMALF